MSTIELRYTKDHLPVRLEQVPDIVAARTGGMVDTTAIVADTLESHFRCFALSGVSFLVKGSAPEHLTRRVFRHPTGKALVETRRITVRYKDRFPQKAIFSLFRDEGVELIWSSPAFAKLYQVRVRNNCDPIDTSVRLLSHKACVYAIPEFLEKCERRSTAMTDPLIPLQWMWDIIHCADAWRIGVRGQGTRIAVLDQGFNLRHTDLAGATFRSGYFQESFSGMNAAKFSADAGLIPHNAHGTRCAALAVGRSGGLGGVGVAPQAALMPIALYESGIASLHTFARAICYAATPILEDPLAGPDDGADVISCSLVPSVTHRPDVADAIQYCAIKGRGGRGTPFFYAVDNNGSSTDSDPIASISGVVAVGSSGRTDLAVGSATGPQLELLAPGLNVVVSDGDGIPEAVDGTSFATPIAAGVAALILQRAGGALVLSDLRRRMRDSCEKIGPLPYDASGRNDVFGFGRIDVRRAMAGG